MSGRDSGEHVVATGNGPRAELTPEERAFLAYIAELATTSPQLVGAGAVADEKERGRE